MANIFGNVPWLGIGRNDIKSPQIFSSFMEGMKLREMRNQSARQEEMLSIQKSQEERASSMSLLEQKVKQQTYDLAKFTLDRQIKERDDAVEAESLIGPFSEAIATATKNDPTDPKNQALIFDFVSKNPKVVDSKHFKPLMDQFETSVHWGTQSKIAEDRNAALLERAGISAEASIERANISAGSREAVAQYRLTIQKAPQDPVLKAQIHLIDRATSEKLQAIYDQGKSLLNAKPIAQINQEAAAAVEDGRVQIENLVNSFNAKKGNPEAAPSQQPETSDALLQGLVPSVAEPAVLPTIKRKSWVPGQGLK